LGVYCSMLRARHCKVCCLASDARVAVDALADCCGIPACGLMSGKYRLIQSDMRSLALKGGYKRESNQQGFRGTRPAALDDENLKALGPGLQKQTQGGGAGLLACRMRP